MVSAAQHSGRSAFDIAIGPRQSRDVTVLQLEATKPLIDRAVDHLVRYNSMFPSLLCGLSITGIVSSALEFMMSNGKPPRTTCGKGGQGVSPDGGTAIQRSEKQIDR